MAGKSYFELCSVRVILSRKGFDSSNGGCPSPIFPDGRLLSLPIPDKTSDIRYDVLEWHGINLGKLASDLTGNPKRRSHFAHLDPDIERQSLPRANRWRPLFGQTGSPQGHLRNLGVQIGDLFLFFGLFRRVEELHGVWRYVKHSPKLHVLWGWLQIGEIHAVDSLAPEALPWARYHPHFRGDRDANNTLYVAADELRLKDDRVSVNGAGLFQHIEDDVVLTAPHSKKVTLWQLPSAFYPSEGKVPLSFHHDLDQWQLISRDYCTLQTVSRGQEFVLNTTHYPDVVDWVASLFRD